MGEGRETIATYPSDKGLLSLGGVAAREENIADIIYGSTLRMKLGEGKQQQRTNCHRSNARHDRPGRETRPTIISDSQKRSNLRRIEIQRKRNTQRRRCGFQLQRSSCSDQAALASQPTGEGHYKERYRNITRTSRFAGPH